MATYNWLDLNDGDVFGADTLPSFDPDADQLIFNDTVTGAADVLIDGDDTTVFLTLDGKTVTLDKSLLALTTTNVSFANGSLLIVGDNTPGTVNDGGANTITGGTGNDQLIGGAGDDRLTQTLGNDVIIGGDGQDILTFHSSTTSASGVTVDLSAGTSVAAGSSATISGIEHVFGSSFADSFTGGDPLHAPILENGDPEIFRPSGGNDTITGAAGHGWITIADYSNATASVTVTLGHSDNLGTASGADIGTDTLINVDRVRGGSGDDLLVGGSYATWANGNFNEHFRGNAGNDTIDGQGSDTTLANIGDNDFVEYVNSPFGVVVNLSSSAITGTAYGTVAAGTARDGFDSMGGGTDTLSGIDVVFGSANNDLLVAGVQVTNTNERLDGRGGNDTVIGSVATSDEADYGNDPSAVLVNLGLGTATDGYGGTDTLVAIEWARGGDFNDTVIGGSNSIERLMGGIGDDLIDGGGTNGVSYAGYQIAVSGVDAFIENGSGTASDGQGGTDTLVNINGLWGGNFNDTLTGGLGNQWFRGRGGDDAINGGAGIDTVNYKDPNPVGVTVNLATGTATDGWGGAWDLQGADTLLNIENVEGSDFNDRITGNAGANRLTGNGGNDSVNGGAGNDTLDGGLGNDTMTGGTGNDTYIINAAGDKVAEAAVGGGTDTVNSSVTEILDLNVENLILTGTGPINGTGNASANTITGNAGNNVLNGMAGADILKGLGGNDTLVWASTDTYDGGVGTDTLKVTAGNLDLTTVVNTKIRNVEQIDLTGGGNNRLTLNVFDVLDISSTTNTLKVLGTAGDSVDIVGAFTVQGVVGDFRTYKVGTGTLLVDTDVVVS